MPRLRLPAACDGCPMRQDGSQGFVPDRLVSNAAVLILGQNPGVDEEQAGEPFVGKTGQWMEQRLFPQAGLTRETVSLANALRCRWRGTNALPPAAIRRGAMRHCMAAYYHPPAATRLVVACGVLAWEALGGQGRVVLGDVR